LIATLLFVLEMRESIDIVFVRMIFINNEDKSSKGTCMRFRMYGTIARVLWVLNAVSTSFSQELIGDETKPAPAAAASGSKEMKKRIPS